MEAKSADGSERGADMFMEGREHLPVLMRPPVQAVLKATISRHREDIPWKVPIFCATFSFMLFPFQSVWKAEQLTRWMHTSILPLFLSLRA